MPAPSDLWEFWDETRAALEKIPADAQRTPAPEHSSEVVLVSHVSMQSYENQRIHGWYAAPPIPSGARVAGLLWLPGYGGMPDVTLAIEWAQKGFATLLLTPRGQGPEPYPEGAQGKLVHEVTDVRRYAYRGVFMDCLRGLEWLQSQPEVHPHRVAVAGGSQGGGLTLATTALSEGRVAVAAAHVPFLCHYEWVIEHPIETGPYIELKDYLAEFPDRRDLVSRTLAYYDPVNLAERIACPVLLTVGLKDTTCPPPTIEAVFEAIPSTKALIVEPEMRHEWREDSKEHMRAWLAHYLD